MPEHVSIYQLTGLAVLALATVVWAIGLTRVLRRSREAALWGRSAMLPVLPYQRQTGPDLESVQLSPAEMDAFAGLVRQLSNGR
ncbi:hypothetical protein [Streptomyces sp. NPDC046909]|uniref:hypothetical protein n=1 Tax=Streptomyces sp. NPDC046909 TaxID=3155617 RepID=UPI0033DA5E4F